MPNHHDHFFTENENCEAKTIIRNICQNNRNIIIFYCAALEQKVFSLIQANRPFFHG